MSGLDRESIWQFKILEYPMIGEAIVNLMRRGNARASIIQSFHNRDRFSDELLDEYWTASSQPVARRALLELQRNLDWSSTEAALDETNTPTLILLGKNDAIRDAGEAKEFVGAMPDAQKRVLDDCGHSAHEDCPDRAISAIAAFLTGA